MAEPGEEEDDGREAIIAAAVEDAMRPLDRLLAPELREWMREHLADAVATFPATAQILDQLRERGPVQRSGSIAKEPAAPVGKPKRGGAS